MERSAGSAELETPAGWLGEFSAIFKVQFTIT
jgi:hypothetical protein